MGISNRPIELLLSDDAFGDSKYFATLTIKINLNKKVRRFMVERAKREGKPFFTKNLAYNMAKLVLAINQHPISAVFRTFTDEELGIRTRKLPTKYPIAELEPVKNENGRWVGHCVLMPTRGMASRMINIARVYLPDRSFISRKIGNQYGVWRVDHNYIMERVRSPLEEKLPIEKHELPKIRKRKKANTSDSVVIPDIKILAPAKPLQRN